MVCRHHSLWLFLFDYAVACSVSGSGEGEDNGRSTSNNPADYKHLDEGSDPSTVRIRITYPPPEPPPPETCFNITEEYGIKWHVPPERNYMTTTKETTVKTTGEDGEEAPYVPVSKMSGGAAPAYPSLIPWQVRLAIHYKVLVSTTLCGGSLISTRWVITAAHCFNTNKKFPVDYVDSFFGDILENQADECEDKRLQNKHYIVHEKYQPPEGDKPSAYDIGLLQLRQPMIMTDYVFSIDLPPTGEAFDDLFKKDFRLVVSGYGRTYYGQPSDILLIL